ncbi:hypothetical protein JCM3770_000437 [Rhodotorula araucariae]
MATTDATLVLQDLLSPPSTATPPATLSQLVALHLATVPLASPHLALVGLLVRYTAQSPALWAAPAPSSWDRHLLAYEALRQGVLLRLDALARPPPNPASPSTQAKGNSGWATRHALHTFLRQVYAGLWTDPTASTTHHTQDGAVDPLVRLALASGVLSALQEWKRRKEKLWVGGASGLDRAEKEAGRAWTEWTQAKGLAGGVELEQLPAWLTAQTVPFVRPEALAAEWPAPALLTRLTDAFSSAFANGHAFSDPPLTADLSQTPEGLEWAVPSPSHTHIAALVQQQLFVALGPLSRAIGRALEAAALIARSRDNAVAQSALSAIHHLSTALLAVASSLSTGWAATPWSDHVDESSLSLTTRTQTAPWTLLKSLLFAQTLIYSSLLEVVSSAPGSSPDTPPTPLQRELASTAVRALARTYFVALRFGQSGFQAWRAVLAGLVEVVAAPLPGASLEAVGARGHPSPAEELVRSLQPAKSGPHDRAVERAAATFWMNTAEQVMYALGDEYVEYAVLKGCRPYLDDAKYRDSFEAAHSVILAVLATGKRCVPDLAPWYTALLLQSYPAVLSATQLRLAYATTVGAVTTAGDDALAWWCIEELLARIDALPLSTPVAEEPAPRPPLRDLADNTVLPAAEAAAPDADAAVSPREERALALPRGALLLVLAALLPSVSLALLARLLDALEARVRLEPRGSDGRAALVETTFEVLGVGMDAVKRAEGVRWWLERGRGLLRLTFANLASPRLPVFIATPFIRRRPLYSRHAPTSKEPAIILRRILSAVSTIMPGSPPSKAARPNGAFPHLTTADTPTLEDVARLIKDGRVKRVMVMAGAGISTAAGIPDFRSPGTGLYDNLAKYNLPYPEAIFDVDYLEEHPEAFYALAKELYPGNFKPTTSHYFFRLLQEKGLLHGCWTQNIDTLERIAGIKDELIVEAHGSFASATCLNCHKAYTKEEIKPAIMRGEVVRCEEKRCKGRDEALIKPDIVFFGEGLPDRFFARLPHFSRADLLLVLGTSLTVGPFNSLLHRVPSACPRVLLNLETVGEAPAAAAAARGRNVDGFDFDARTARPDGLRDVRWLGEADRGVEELCRLLGWDAELHRLKEQGWREIDEAEGRAPAPRGEAREGEEDADEDREEKRDQVVERVEAAAGGQSAVAAKGEDAEDVDALAKAVEDVSLDAEAVPPVEKSKTTPAL